MEKAILNVEDLLHMLDHLLREPKLFWEDFYEDRNKKVPFFQNHQPDENLVEYFENDLKPERVLELGCGPGRNAIYMAQKGCAVDAIDISGNAVNWARERANEAGVSLNLYCKSLFEFDFEPNSYDFVYDSGLFHHLPPHRRITYLEIVKRALKDNGYFGIVCFNPDGSNGISDWEVYEERSLKGGIGYTEDRFKEIFTQHFAITHFRRMRKSTEVNGLFGEDFLWTSLMRKK
ncbi:class I SAM-dependent methyltransferase [Cytobacillus sp. FJAT-54145]|uniref:Class I SAM-dependent methyltransferase n=1 Tax=Cytobacillus spartinae TaxID=3299023 RepID=A0ABW6K615_9BACI